MLRSMFPAKSDAAFTNEHHVKSEILLSPLLPVRERVREHDLLSEILVLDTALILAYFGRHSANESVRFVWLHRRGGFGRRFPENPSDVRSLHRPPLRACDCDCTNR